MVACEPLPATFAVLEANLASHRQWCSERGVQPGRVVAIEAGLGDGSRESATFTLYEGAAGEHASWADGRQLGLSRQQRLRRVDSVGAGPGCLRLNLQSTLQTGLRGVMHVCNPPHAAEWRTALTSLQGGARCTLMRGR